MKSSSFQIAVFVAAMAAASTAWAGEGHDHGGAPSATGEALPRFSAVSETFELVGVLSGKQITLYLDRFSTNSPVRDAQIELEIGAAKYKAEKQGEDEYEVVLPDTPKAGVLPVIATVTAGNEVDLLAGELDIHAVEPASVAANATTWTKYAAWAAAALAAVALLAWGARRVFTARSLRTEGAA